MTPEQARQLERMIWKQRLKLWVPAVAIVAAVFGFFAWATAEKAARVDRTVETHAVAGTVISAAKLSGRRGHFQVIVRLGEGKEVNAVSLLPEPPYKGESVELRASTHASGRVSYAIVKDLR